MRTSGLLVPTFRGVVYNLIAIAIARLTKCETLKHRVDRDVPIAICFLKYRAGTARSTLPEVLSIS